jgi:hypothetical protein
MKTITENKHLDSRLEELANNPAMLGFVSAGNNYVLLQGRSKTTNKHHLSISSINIPIR